ncbi:TlpA family protein disulfide reductase [Aestuariibaculum suncheonense]|uniref:TlpA family protein disulfide reductase n=1 Tax=Aestuariibaculum suncheonense TaxID=1028745 RepID=A0A8J6UAL1_9FLAO|nr:TlpA disulfide reductase family protein [Aestuariibaculum suncheonense]MBD0834960.1 TlpA family protein disulfide reductase [Aestuariibaculum suncheonense]
MKKLLILSTAVAMMACKETPQVDYALIGGTIKNLNPTTKITLNTPDGTVKEDLPIAENGSFTDTLNTDKNLYAIYDGKTPVFLYVEPGFNLNVNYDINDVQNSLTITGKGAEINNYLVAKRKLESELFGNPRETYTLNEADYKAKLSKIKEELTTLFNDTQDLPDNFKAKELRNIHYFYLNLHNNYENAHRALTQNPTFSVSDDFSKELKDVDYSSAEDFKYSTYYKNLVSSHYSTLANEVSTKDSIDYDIAYLKTVSTIPNQDIKNTLVFDFANNNIGRSKDVDAFYKLYLENSNNDENNAIIAEKHDKLMALAEGKPSPSFSDYVNYEGGKTSLADLKGKYVYIDVWATWCGPCKREIPFLKEVEEKFHDKNIEFVSISIDQQKDFEKWKAMVAEKELKGVQLFADNDWKSSFVQDYQINGIPRFILIDPNGNIVNSNAPRPSSPALTELFTSLNI